MRNQAFARKNQWLRSADGGKLAPRKIGDNGEGRELGRTTNADISITESQDYRIVQRDMIETGRVIVGSGIRGHDI